MMWLLDLRSTLLVDLVDLRSNNFVICWFVVTIHARDSHFNFQFFSPQYFWQNLVILIIWPISMVRRKQCCVKNLQIGKSYSKKMVTCDVIPSKISIVWLSRVECTNKHPEPLIKHMASCFVYYSGWWWFRHN